MVEGIEVVDTDKATGYAYYEIVFHGNVFLFLVVSLLISILYFLNLKIKTLDVAQN